MPSTDTPGTSDASAAAHSGTTTCSYPASAAASTAGRVPRTGRTRPSRPSSPIMTMSASTRGSSRSAAPSTALATARSKPLPALGTEAGLRPTVSFFWGHSAPEFTTAARTRSRLSVRLLSGSPTRVNAATPGSRSAWTSTTTPSTPTRATAQVRAKPMSGHPPHMLDPGRSAGGQHHAHQVDADAAGRCSAVVAQPASGQVPQTLGLDGRHRLHRVLEGTGPAGLHLADHQDVPVPGHDVDLAGPAAAPVALQDRHPGLGQPSRGQRLAVPAQRAARPLWAAGRSCEDR